MDRKQIMIQLNGIFRDAFMDSALEISEQTSAKDIEDWDSLMQITLITAIEKKYGVQFSLDDVLGLENVGGMVDLILRETKRE
ncbi:acyl carrier protein [Lachnospiraceae bacterium 47-T17]